MSVSIEHYKENHIQMLKHETGGYTHNQTNDPQSFYFICNTRKLQMLSDHYDIILYQRVVSARSGTKRTFPLCIPFSLSLSPTFLFPVI